VYLNYVPIICKIELLTELNMILSPLISHQISNDTKITIFAAEDILSTHPAGTEKFQVITTLIQQNMNRLKMQHHFKLQLVHPVVIHINYIKKYTINHNSIFSDMYCPSSDITNIKHSERG
jgi:hypothetical protein